MRRNIDDLLPYLLARAGALVSRRFYALLKRQGMPVNEWRVLAGLSDGDGVALGDLAEMILAEQSTTTRLVDRMAARGLVRRETDAGDRRRTLLYITEAGRAAIGDLLVQARAIDREILAAFDAARGARLKADLEALIDEFEAESHRNEDPTRAAGS